MWELWILSPYDEEFMGYFDTEKEVSWYIIYHAIPEEFVFVTESDDTPY